MIFHWLMSLFVPWIAGLSANAFDLNLNTNSYFIMALSYLMEADTWFPISDGYIPIFGLSCVVYAFLGTTKVIEIITNAVRGAGLRI